MSDVKRTENAKPSVQCCVSYFPRQGNHEFISSIMRKNIEIETEVICKKAGNKWLQYKNV